MKSSVTRQPAQEIMMQTFATPAPVTAVVGIPAGFIRVIAADRADTIVEVRPADPSKGRDVKLAGQVTASYSDGTVRVAGPARSRVLGSSGAVQVTVRVPAGSGIAATAASAQLITTGPLGEVSFDSSQGTVEVEQAATARVSTVDGSIRVGRVAGDAHLRTVTGDIHLTEAAAGTVDLDTQTGTVTVGAAAGVSATLDAGTTRGRVRNALRNTGGTPGLAIHATTILGDITATSL